MSDHSHVPSERRQQAMTDALRAWDPEADVTVEAGTGRLVVSTTLSAERVAIILKEADAQARCGGEGAGRCCGRCAH